MSISICDHFATSNAFYNHEHEHPLVKDLYNDIVRTYRAMVRPGKGKKGRKHRLEKIIGRKIQKCYEIVGYEYIVI
jgi:hypothetical protein